MTVSRGVPAHRGLLPDPEPAPSLVVHVQPFAGYPAELYSRGMRAITSRMRRNERSPLEDQGTELPGHVLARREASARGADEALLVNTARHLVCASAANLFLVLDEALVTPSVASGALPGTVRELIATQLAPRMGVAVVQGVERREEQYATSEVFLTSALLGVMPLTEVDGLPVGDGSPGHISLSLGAELGRLMARPSR